MTYPNRKGWPLRTIGFVWTQTPTKTWLRHVIRRYDKSGTHELSEVEYVEQDDLLQMDFCLRCLGQRLEQLPHRLYVWLHCLDCDFDFRVL